MLGKYEDDIWLGQSGDRTRSSEGEWPVAYHGTHEVNVRNIVREGLRLDKGKRFVYALINFMERQG